ncbi:hypothetical protein Ddye_031570 [Dipteronia dyeriana]|uniref:Uncharacterized protein n=1 Tax=Dipteronia dyeriana TaxID=168575 RepID=A0AAD9TJ46_9ROSI|nr:hypothetical protein Ddye_031570 [Dipteronia dyeriana]
MAAPPQDSSRRWQKKHPSTRIRRPRGGYMDERTVDNDELRKIVEEHGAVEKDERPLCGYGFTYNEEKQSCKTFQVLSSAELEPTQPVEGSQRQDTICNNENE